MEGKTPAAALPKQLKRLGALPDWEMERFTLDEGLSEAVRKVFVDLYSQGLIYRDRRLVNWDPKLCTAISDLEVEQKETQGNYWYIRYPIEGEAGFVGYSGYNAPRNHAWRYGRCRSSG